MRAPFIVAGLLAVAGVLSWWSFRHEPPAPAPLRGAAEAGASASVEPETAAPDAAGRTPVEGAEESAANQATSADATPAHAVRVTLRGRVLDARSLRPLAGAVITLLPGGVRAEAAADGRYALTFLLAEGRVALEGTHPGFLPARRVVWNHRVPRGGTVERFDFELLPAGDGAVLVGQIVDARGAAAPGARVRLGRTPSARAGTRPPEELRETDSGNDGRFRFDGVPPGSWDLRVEAPGLEDYDRSHLELAAGSTTDLGAIRLGAGGWARFVGRVVDAGGAGLMGATVSVRQLNGARTATTANDGGFAVDRVAPGRWQVGVEHARRRVGIGLIEFGVRETVEREIPLPGGPHHVGGQVLLGTTPAADLEVTVEVAGASGPGFRLWITRTGRDGRFRLDGLPPGPYDLGFTQEGPYAVFAAEAVAADRDDHRFVFPVVVHAARLVGVVRDPAGVPIEGASVAPVHPLGDATRGATGRDGRYAIDVVLSTDMTNLIVAECPGYLVGQASVARDMMDATGRIELDFTLSPEAQAGSIAGVVTDERGAPVHGVECVVRSDADPGAWRARTDSAGRFMCAGVAPGEIRVDLRHSDFAVYRETVGHLDARGRLAVEIALVALQRFARTVLVRGAGGEPLSGVAVDVWRGHHIMAVTTDGTGRALLRDLPAGAIALSVEVDGYARCAMDCAVDGPPAGDIVFQLQRGQAALEGVVAGPDGRPRDNTEVIVERRGGEGAAGVQVITSTDADGRFRVEHLVDVEHDVLVWTGSRQVRHVARPAGGPLRIVVDGR